MTFSDNYLKYLDVLQNIGMTSINPVNYNGTEIIPLQILKRVLPDTIFEKIIMNHYKV